MVHELVQNNCPEITLIRGCCAGIEGSYAKRRGFIAFHMYL